jgi:dimeric dUTPase (all-alpha-NTP-PPase superfamily)
MRSSEGITPPVKTSVVAEGQALSGKASDTVANPKLLIWRGPNLHSELGSVWGTVLSATERLLPPGVLEEMKRESSSPYRIIKDGVSSGLSEGGIRAMLKAVEGEARFRGEEFSTLYRYYIGWEGLGGYLNVNTDEDKAAFEADVKDWLFTVRKHEVRGSKEKFDSYFKSALNYTLDYMSEGAKFISDDWIGIDKPVDDPMLWGSSGVAKKIKATKVGELGIKKQRVSKAFEALSLEPETIRREMSRYKPATIRVFAKPEATKNRPVASVDEDNIVWWWSTVKTAAEKLFTRGAWFLQSSQQQLQNWGGAIAEQGARRWAIPLDQAKFDHYITPGMHIQALEALERALLQRTTTPSQVAIIQKAFSHIIYAVKNAVVDGSSNVQGYWSGLPYTMFLGSVMNLAEFFVARKLIYEEHGEWINILDVAAQGDDLFLITDKDWLLPLFKTYVNLGFKMNLTKNFSSTTRNEYLRNVITENGITGYPMRSAKSLIWRKNEPMLPTDNFYEYFRQLVQYSQRAFGRVDEVLLASVLAQQFPLPEASILTALDTPACLGGLGLGVSGNLAYTAVFENVVSEDEYQDSEWRNWGKFDAVVSVMRKNMLGVTRSKFLRREFKKVDSLHVKPQSIAPVSAYGVVLLYAKGVVKLIPSPRSIPNVTRYTLSLQIASVEDDISMIEIDSEHKRVLVKYRSIMTKRLFWDTVNDRIDVRRPVSNVMGDLTLNLVYDVEFYGALNNMISYCTSSSRLGYLDVARAARRAEYVVRSIDVAMADQTLYV